MRAARINLFGSGSAMPYFLFVDNFRGFANARIPITHVNFLVGQNSTGKSSILGLVKLFSGPRFLFQPDLADDEVNFGAFGDMVSAHSRDRTFFRIGLVWQEPGTKRGRRKTVGWLSTFVEEEGLPRLSRFTLCRGQDEVSLRLDGGDILYRTRSYKRPVTADSVLDSILPAWVGEHSGRGRGHRVLRTPRGMGSRLPLMMMLPLVLGGGARAARPRRGSVRLALPPPDVTPPHDVTWIAPIRTKPMRTYDDLTLSFSPEGGHTPYLIRRMLRTRSAAERFHAFMRRVGSASGLFQDVRIEKFGSSGTGPFAVDIVLDGKALNLSTVGYGVSQSLPVLVEILARAHGTWFAIQQPEVHLHPSAQAALGDLIFQTATADHKIFLVETHSDFTIDRFRMNFRDRGSEKPESQILFFERRNRHNVVTPLPIGKSGDLPADQPKGYRDFFVREELRLLGI